jgi:Holliday junction resolvase RusA-like endonuclease
MTKTGHTYNPTTTRAAEKLLKEFFSLRKKRNMPWSGPLGVTLTFFFSRPGTRKSDLHHVTRPDLDNLIKLVLDSGNGLLWEDDKQIVFLEAAKHYCSTEGDPGIEITVEEF